MITRIAVSYKITDTRALMRRRKLQHLDFGNKIRGVSLVDIYTVEKNLNDQDLRKVADILANPVTQEAAANTPQSPKIFDWAIEIGFLPGVTDNVANTTKEMIEDTLKTKLSSGDGVYSSQITFITGDLTKEEAKKIAENLANPLIQRIAIKSYKEFQKDHGMNPVVPKVTLHEILRVTPVNLNVSDEKLEELGKNGIADTDGGRRGPLALDLVYLKTIQAYFKKLGRNPTDIELESLAQTWSEHCKHTIFNSPIDEIEEGLFKKYIKGATEKIRKDKGADDRCISVFFDNSGGIEFDDTYVITHKVETHNSPSALDPFGGAVTGIVGVNRDAIGFGLGAKPVANFYGYCFANPTMDIPLYKDHALTQKNLPARRIMDGVIEGVNAGGNQSGIPTPQGFVYFNESYRGKPLVFVGTLGLIPKKVKGKPAYLKKAKPDDFIVMIGGRVGKDGIHGATFSSESLHAGSPITAVQIGDPITQKKLSDAIVKEARDLNLYNSITDDGAGGLSCSVAEMAKESGGCKVFLEKVPLKYPGLAPWEIWISESQERMTLAVPKRNWPKFLKLMKRRGVEATVIGEFTDSGKCIVTYKGKTIMDIDMHFLHDGLPERHLTTAYKKPQIIKPKTENVSNATPLLLRMLSRLNIAGFEFITQQYDYIVQGNAALPPLQGKGRINADTTAVRPVLSSQKTVLLSQALYPTYSDMDTYGMAAASLDTAVRNIVAAGGDLKQLYLLDNFCWCSSFDRHRLGQLKEAARACYDCATTYGTPFISGKDSMFNDFSGFDKTGLSVKISVLPTLLISSLGIVDEVSQLVSLDVKQPGDLLYVLGETFEELGGSEYFSMISEKKYLGGQVPNVNALINKKLYQKTADAIRQKLIASSISVGRGGLAVALAKISMGGKLGIQVSLKNISDGTERDDFALFSESQGRILVSIDRKNKVMFEKIIHGSFYKEIGTVTKDKKFVIKGIAGNTAVETDVDTMLKAYRQTFKGY